MGGGKGGRLRGGGCGKGKKEGRGRRREGEEGGKGEGGGCGKGKKEGRGRGEDAVGGKGGGKARARARHCFVQPTTELEKEVAAILASSPSVEEEGEELTEAEKKSLLQMTLEEVTAARSSIMSRMYEDLGAQVLERKKALRKHRALVSYYEQKCRRVGRIKSKKLVTISVLMRFECWFSCVEVPSDAEEAPGEAREQATSGR